MIVRIQAPGGSFVGAGKYYLHDKLDAERLERVQGGAYTGRAEQTDARVWFTDVRNCLNIDPERALEEMWHTADDQAYLKMQAGVPRGGRVCEDPVKTISLSWHKDDRPEPQHMIESADAFLKHMGWDQHQAVYVGHNDTEHRHIHIVLNRVQHENGRTLDDYREQKRAQVWALAYEKEHDKVRCEERELRAAKRENREPELNQRQQDAPAPMPVNDHLPHNVVVMARPHEQAFDAAEQQRRDQARSDDHAQLKAEQRAEREAFFTEGRQVFKAARQAAYHEVRDAYAPEWREFYKEAEAADKSAEAWSATAVTRAAYFAKEGRWGDARSAFDDRDSVRDAVAADLAERKADLKARQTEDVRDRQAEVCGALMESRHLQYQELLARHREERAALKTGHTLEDLGYPRPAATPEPVNENEASRHAAVPSPPQLVADGPSHDLALVAPANETAQLGAVSDVPSPAPAPTPEVPEVSRQIADLAAGAIGGAASYLADQLGEMFAPTPPEVREAQAKADAKRDAEKPAPTLEDKMAGYARHIEAAIRVIDAERREQEDRDYWEERDRGKGFERDR